MPEVFRVLERFARHRYQPLLQDQRSNQQLLYKRYFPYGKGHSLSLAYPHHGTGFSHEASPPYYADVQHVVYARILIYAALSYLGQDQQHLAWSSHPGEHPESHPSVFERDYQSGRSCSSLYPGQLPSRLNSGLILFRSLERRFPFTNPLKAMVKIRTAHSSPESYCMLTLGRSGHQGLGAGAGEHSYLASAIPLWSNPNIWSSSCLPVATHRYNAI